MNKTLDRIFAALFALEGAAALFGVLFRSATWHIVTVVLCAVLVIAFLADAEAEEASNDVKDETTAEGYDRINDHHPYPVETRGGRE